MNKIKVLQCPISMYGGPSAGGYSGSIQYSEERGTPHITALQSAIKAWNRRTA